MKARYTPGNPDGTVGKSYIVEVIGLKWAKVKHIELPVVKEIHIKYKDGKTEWVNGMKFYNSTIRTKIIDHITY